MELEPLTEHTAAMAATWFDHDDEGRRRLGFYAGHPKWWHLVEANANRHGFVAAASGTAIGFVDLDDRAGVVSVSVYTRPVHRGHGHGAAALAAAAEVARSLEGARQPLAEVDADNTASIRSCTSAGMTLRPRRNEHDELVFELDLTA